MRPQASCALCPLGSAARRPPSRDSVPQEAGGVEEGPRSPVAPHLPCIGRPGVCGLLATWAVKHAAAPSTSVLWKQSSGLTLRGLGRPSSSVPLSPNSHGPPPSTPPFRRPGLGPTTSPSVRPYVLLSRSLPPFPHLARHTHSSSSSAVSPEQTGDSSRDMQVSANSAQRSWVIREISGQNAVPLGSHTLIDLQSHVLSEDSSHLISKM